MTSSVGKISLGFFMVMTDLVVVLNQISKKIKSVDDLKL
jgi:hypothetical protein